MIIDVVTIFPAMVESALDAGVVGRARTSGLVDIKVRDLRDYTDDRHRDVDDIPYRRRPGDGDEARAVLPGGGGDRAPSAASRRRWCW